MAGITLHSITSLNQGLKNLLIHLSWPVDDAKLYIRDAPGEDSGEMDNGQNYDSILQGKFAASEGVLG